MDDQEQALAQEPAGYQFRQRSGVGKGPQSAAPWCDWCFIDRETYDQYRRQPNKSVQVRPVYAAPCLTSAGCDPHQVGKIVKKLHGERDHWVNETLDLERQLVEARRERDQALAQVVDLEKRLKCL